MITAELDHLVIAAENLTQGEDYIESKLGVKPVTGGRHPKQGTHNSLLKLGKSRYLEIIAIDPDGIEPKEPRWFDLDNPVLQESIAKRPRFIGWVARTSNMKQALLQASYDPGTPRDASRGKLRWSFTFTPDGSLIEKGILPPLIEWKTTAHPSNNLPESGIDLKKIQAFHPSPDTIRRHLASLSLDSVCEVGKGDPSEAGLYITLSTSWGEVKLNGLGSRENE